MSDMKNDPNRQMSNQNKGSGSDTASAAKISAGTSVGTVGQSPMPHTQQGSGSGTGTGSGTSGQSASSGSATDTIKQASQSAGETVRQAAGQMQDKASEVHGRASSWASDHSEHTNRGRSGSMKGMRGASRGMQGYVAENPVMLGLIGLAAGLLIGSLLPRTRREEEFLGEWADEMRSQGMRYARDMAQRGREYLEENLGEDQPLARRESELGKGQSGGANRH